ncbi:hypothetical protein HanIR_Chr17g0898961 [Helianthus annuus]|nr:hypothetical protein HanIR_Chr17g0898961 [Helianthus annuus]
MSNSETHTMVGKYVILSNLFDLFVIALHHGWSRFAPFGNESLQYVSEALRLSVEPGGWTMRVSEPVLDSPPKKGWIRMLPLKISGFRCARFAHNLNATLCAILPPALSPTKYTLEKSHCFNHHLLETFKACCFSHISAFCPSSYAAGRGFSGAKR